jgi:hypothetical protein
VTTALGPIRITRRYTWSGELGGCHPADDALGVDGFLTTQARRMLALVGVEHSFDRGHHVLRELCGWTVDAEVIRRTTHAEARRAQADRPERGDAARFASTPGEVEVLIDAGKVNTLDGWRDVKVGVFLKRPVGAPARPDEWASRALPAASIRTVVAGVEGVERFGPRVRAESDRLGVTSHPTMTVLADGGEWIWNVASEHWPQAVGVLDVFHAVQAVGEAVKAIWGADGAGTADRIASGRTAVVSGGKGGIERWIGEQFAALPAGNDGEPLRGLAAYLAKHPTRLTYAERLAGGRSIGSGAVEGSIKQLVNLRMKRTGARWRAEHVGPLVELRALSLTTDWQSLWVAA